MAALVSPGKQASIKRVLAILEEKFGPEGATATQWAKACKDNGISKSTFDRRLREAKSQGLVKKEGDGQGALYRVVKSEAVSVSADVKPMS
jgi:DNA-binding transcriptional ArsR family regulator